jgi:uncharacterized protein (DUF433 family)
MPKLMRIGRLAVDVGEMIHLRVVDAPWGVEILYRNGSVRAVRCESQDDACALLGRLVDAANAPAPCVYPLRTDTSSPPPDRLVINPAVSATSPVVKGTWVTVDHVVSLVADGWMWGDILRAHPELTEADVRACLAHAAADEGQATTEEQP